MMNRCNFCIVQGIKRTADNAGGIVIIQPKPTCYAPEGVDIFIRYPDDAEGWAAWLMRLPDRCVC